MEQKLRIASRLSVPVTDLQFRFSRSSGAGGQHVNKVSTRVELVFDVNNSSSLSATQKEIILTRLKSRIDADGCLRVSSQDSRSQWRNREDVLQKLIGLLSKALKEVRPRIVTSATRTSRERRLKTKKLESRKKATRQYPDIE